MSSSVAVRLAGLVSILFQFTGCGQRTTELELITPALPSDREIAEELVAAISPESGVRLRLVPAPDGRAQLDALEDGYGDLALTSNNQPYRAQVATILPLYPTVLHILVRATDIGTDPRQLIPGARVLAGPEGSISRLVFSHFVEQLHIDPGEFEFVDGPGTDPDIVILYVPIDPDAARDAAPGYRLVSIGEPGDIGRGEDIDRALLLNPQLRAFVIPAGTYETLNPEPVVTLAVDKLLVARRGLADTAAYDLIREVLAARPALAAKRPTVFRSLNEDFDPNGTTFTIHPGARAYLHRDEPTWIERYSGVGEVLVTAFVAIVSGLYAAINIFRFRRKNRIDVYYSRVFGLKDRIGPDASDSERAAAIAELRNLQREAYRELAAERLAANESFRIFVTLANDTIDEIEGGAQP